MLDINFIRENPEKVKKATKNKGYNPDVVDEVLRLDKERRKLIQEVEKLRAERNIISQQPTTNNQQQGRKIKKKLKDIALQLKRVEKNFKELLLRIPNLPSPDVPVGKDEKDNVVIRKWGIPPKFDFKPKDHLKLGEALDILDFKSGAKVAGSSFYYLKNEGVLLELALVQYGIDFLKKKGYTSFITPDLARERFYLGTGYLPDGPEAQTYTVNNTDLGLVATSEVTLAGFHSDEILKEQELPKRYSGYSHCFRVEAGAYGKYSKGLYRVHQFTKVEMFIYCWPEQSEKLHKELLENEEEFWRDLEIPYRVVEMCTSDLGAQAAKKFDLEAWMPGRDNWGEITSTSNTTDYQARRLNIKYKKDEKTNYVHTLNGTLVATPRAIIAILENYQQKDGSVKIPAVLQKYVGKKYVRRTPNA